MTKKLYFETLPIFEFEANIEKLEQHENNWAITLNQTAFYPESGGQPCDKGSIDGQTVQYVLQKNGEIQHILEKPPLHKTVYCEVNKEARFDYTQQHSGQHIISACFLKLYDAETNSFHIGEDMTTIEIKLDEFNLEMLADVENMANDIIYRNIPVTAKIYDLDELKTLPLRKQPKVKENIRVIEIKDIDYSPCGGTHVLNTGEVGLIKIKRFEKCKDWYRIEFVCGKRALLDYRMKNNAMNNIGAMLSLRDFEAEAGVSKLISDMVELQKNSTEMKKELHDYMAKELMINPIQINEYKVIKKVFTDKDMNGLKHIAQCIIENPSYLVLLACSGEKAQILFSKSDNVPIDMGKLLKSNLEIIHGKGGGNHKTAQGGGNNPQKLEELFCNALEDIKRQI